MASPSQYILGHTGPPPSIVQQPPHQIGPHAHQFGRVYNTVPTPILRCLHCGVTMNSPLQPPSMSQQNLDLTDDRQWNERDFRCLSVCKYNKNTRPFISDYGPMVKIIAGKDDATKQFIVHTGLVSWASSYFKAAFQKDRFKEGAEGVVRLEEDKPYVVERFIEWLYNGRVMWYNTSNPANMKKLVSSLIIYELYTFADCRGIRTLKNDIIDALTDSIARTWTSIPPDAIEHIYENVPRSNPMARLMVTYQIQCTKTIKPPMIDEDYIFEQYPPEFLLDYILALESRKSSVKAKRVGWCMMDRCAFHDHPEEEKKSEMAPQPQASGRST
ncbi:BTB/POZ-like protein [Botryosphaeria dothidea]|uniref:BTB/POZ-like protein n=1 Tax=Botryosphaeria dothidea TaxID=55169 RepID=A0A8H4IIW8_9PEZI|nr:BTB/POZ-like protein [Botryosphaeria dothidea]